MLTNVVHAAHSQKQQQAAASKNKITATHIVHFPPSQPSPIWRESISVSFSPLH
jgi:hypothetical protein